MSVPKAPLSLPKAPVEPIAAVGTTPAVAKVETEITGITGTFTSTSQAAKGTEIGQKANASSSAALPRLVPPPPPRSQLKPPVVEIMSTSGFCSKHRFQMFEYFIWSESYVTSYMTFFFILWHSTLTSKAAMQVMERISCQLWALWLGIQVETCRDSPSVDYKASSLFKLNDTVLRFS